jgi:hypothetical protein
VRDIPLADAKSCVVIYAPNGARKPHMIKYRGHMSFRTRHGRAKRRMTMQEVRINDEFRQ